MAAGGRRRWVTAIVGVVAAVGLLAGGLLIAVDQLHLQDRIVSGGRIRHCWLLGGSSDVEFHLWIELDPDLRLEDFGRIIEEGHDLVVARVVERESGAVVGYGAWNMGDSDADPTSGAVDALARRVSRVHSNLDERDLRSQIRAARECSERDIPH